VLLRLILRRLLLRLLLLRLALLRLALLREALLGRFVFSIVGVVCTRTSPSGAMYSLMPLYNVVNDELAAASADENQEASSSAAAPLVYSLAIFCKFSVLPFRPALRCKLAQPPD
jgi:hypothetical protein